MPFLSSSFSDRAGSVVGAKSGLRDSASATARQRIDSYTQTINVLVKAQTWGEWLRSVSEEINAVKAIAIALGGIATAALGWLGISASRRSRSPTKPRKPRAPAAKSGGV